MPNSVTPDTVVSLYGVVFAQSVFSRNIIIYIIMMIYSTHGIIWYDTFGTPGTIGVARGGQGRAFAPPSLIFALPLKSCQSK